MPSLRASVHSMVIISRAMLFLFLGWFFFDFVVFVGFGAAGGIDGAQAGQAALAQGAFAFKLALGFHGETRPRDGVQAGAGMGLPVNSQTP